MAGICAGEEKIAVQEAGSMAMSVRGVSGSRHAVSRRAAPGVTSSRLAVVLAWAVLCALAAVCMRSASVEACVGARPLAMGGAFVGVAGDPSDTYWNPAGLVALDRAELSITHTLNNRDWFNYDEFVAYAWPDGPHAAAGLGFVAEHVGVREGEGAFEASRWLWGAVSRALSEDLSVGANVRREFYERRAQGAEMLTGTRWGLDVGLLYSASPELSVGLLLQDAGFSPIVWEDGHEQVVRANIRPGLAYMPDSRTVVAIDVYDLAGLLDSMSGGLGGSFALRAGIERRIAAGLVARVGYYGITATVGALTGGIGWSNSAWQLDYAYLGTGTIPGHPGLGGTHQIGVTYKF